MTKNQKHKEKSVLKQFFELTKDKYLDLRFFYKLYNSAFNTIGNEEKRKKEIFYGWYKLNRAILALAKQIRKSKIKFENVYGIPKGGLIPAVMLSYQLNLPLTSIPNFQTLIVDNISDTGKTLKKFKNYKICCLFSTPWTKVKPTWSYFEKIDKQTWITFPWEKKQNDT